MPESPYEITRVDTVRIRVRDGLLGFELCEDDARAFAEEILRNLPTREEPAPPSDAYRDLYLSACRRNQELENEVRRLALGGMPGVIPSGPPHSEIADLRAELDKWKQEAEANLNVFVAHQKLQAKEREERNTYIQTLRSRKSEALERSVELSKENDRLHKELEIFRSTIASGSEKLKSAASDLDLVMKQRDEYVEKYNALLRTVQSA